MTLQRRHEPLGIDVGRVGRLAITAGIVFLLTLVASFALWVWWLRPPATADISPALPAPPVGAEVLRHQQQQRLQEYGWADESNGIARIPLSRAMELMLSTVEPEASSRIPDDNIQPEAQQ